MARLTKADSVYRISLHKNGAYMYATTHPYTVAEDGKRKYSCLHWGTVTDELKFYPKSSFSQLDAARNGGGVYREDLPAGKMDVRNILLCVHRTHFADEPHAMFLEDPVVPHLVCLGQGRRVNNRWNTKVIGCLFD